MSRRTTRSSRCGPVGITGLAVSMLGLFSLCWAMADDPRQTPDQRERDEPS
jgi:hypothetical protein